MDTDVLLSGLAYPASVPGQIVGVWKAGELDVVLSRYIIEEMVRVLPKMHRIKLTSVEIRDLADSFLFVADIVEPASIFEQDLRDPDDQRVLGTLIAAKADYLLTGDKDLLALAGRYPVITPSAFWQRHGQ